MKKKLKHKLKRLLAVLLVIVMAGAMLPDAMVTAKEQEDIFPYAIFASSDKEGAVTINAQNTCVNGRVLTNGTITSSGNMNLNGTKTEHAGVKMPFIFDKIDTAYFKGDSVSRQTGDYTVTETNISLNTPAAVDGNTELSGNINSVNALKSSGDIRICGNVMNANNSVICSENGSIIIESDNVNMTGLLYAPNGSIRIKSQSLNLNSTIIIAEDIVIDCYNANINYNSDMGKLIGAPSDAAGAPTDNPEKKEDGDNPTESPGNKEEGDTPTESPEHKEDGDTPADNPEHTKDENGNGIPDYYEDYDNWAGLADSDGDGLPDVIEEFIKTDKDTADSDGDGLDDFYEVFVTYTDPTLVDSDKNGISDADEDFDKDGLTNIQERDWKTGPYNEDTDEDGLKDGDEVNKHKTDPMKPDSDDDRLEDADEIFFRTAPLNPDTDGNGILDGDEKRPQTFVYENGDSVIENVTISMEATGKLQRTSEIDNIMDKDILCSEVVGLVGEPFSIETESKFDKAEITFKVDKSKLGDTEFEDLLFLWYDEENYEFVELETVCDEENGTVSVETTHFSKYMIVDSKKWIEAWAAELNYSPDISGGDNKTVYNTVLAIDYSASMKYSDPVISYEYGGGNDIEHQKTCMRIEIMETFIDNMNDDDRMGIVFFNDRGYISNEWERKGSDKLKSTLQMVKRSGIFDYDIKDLNVAIRRSIRALTPIYIEQRKYNRRIILVSNGKDVSFPASEQILYNSKYFNIKIFTLGIDCDEVGEKQLRHISESTGGRFYKVSTADDIVNAYAEIVFDGNFDTTDTDGDGLYDVVETEGIRIQNGTIIRGCDPYEKDTDGDGLSDGEEIDPEPYSYTKEIRNLKTNETFHANGHFFKERSNALNRDSDGDGLLDGKRQYYEERIIAPIDPEPLVYTGERGLWKKHTLSLNDKNDLENNFSKDYAREQRYFDIILKDGKVVCNNREAEEVGVNRKGLGAFLGAAGSYTLSFTYDDKHIALHSDLKQGQIKFGYNDFYDWVFHKATSMDKMKLDFELEGKPYVVWAWKGNYLNLGPGAEIGVYTQNLFYKKLDDFTSLEHWVVGKERFPMTISLYRKNFDSNRNITGYSNYFNWMFGGKQWWATGFVPDINSLNSITADKLIQITSVDFHDNPAMLAALKAKWENNIKYGKNLIFDMEVNRLWIMW